MNCSECHHLDQVFESKLAAYVEARADPFFQVSSGLAASKQVDMERAKSDVEEHRLACHFALVKGFRVRREDVLIETVRHAL